MEVRAVKASDLDQIARIHQAAFPGFFLTEMGLPFLRSYYGLVLEFDGGILLAAETQTGLAGFVSGFKQPEAFYALYSKRKLSFIFPILLGIARNPLLLPRIIANVGRVENAAAVPASTEVVELSSVAVHPDAAGQGLGSKLVFAFREKALAMGGHEIRLTTDADGNEAVNRFYVNQGFLLSRVFATAGKRKMNEYQLCLVSDAAVGSSS